MARPRGYRVERMSRARLALAAGQDLAVRRHLMYALVEADLTVPRQLLREHQPADRRTAVVTFDHDVVDGAPAARFTSRLLELLAAGDPIREAISAEPDAGVQGEPSLR
jgi:hypothetical protein